MAEYDRRNAAPPPLPMKYASGTLRLTRTPERQHAPNAISLDDLIHPPDVSSTLVYSFFIEDPYLFDFLPFKTSRHHRPYVNVHVGRDITTDADGKQFAGCKPKTKRPKPVDFDRVVELAKKGFREQYANNFQAFYPKLHSGCAHSKIMVLVYLESMRVVITSANFAIPSMGTTIGISSEPESPPDFIRQYLKLASSTSPLPSGEQTYEYGQLRLRKVVRSLLKKRYGEDKNKVPKMTFEIKTDSGVDQSCRIRGHLENEGVYDARCESVEVRACCALHPPIWFPSVVSLCPPTRIAFVDPQGNISSHIDWNALEEKNTEYLKDVFHHYYSKDRARASSPFTRRPKYMCLGSTNFSSSAWGKVEREGRNRVIAAMLRTERLEKMANFECGVVVRGEDIEGMLEPGSRWEDIVPYERPTEVNHYKDGERPWKMRRSDIEGPEPPIMDWDDADADDENKD
ncbi:hypothetical protein B0H13DRAFT_1883168 [Mycena leptocephala]|nr:hypothetical protein B0H13DRAFT_1883168 [Mycena leptocephala]